MRRTAHARARGAGLLAALLFAAACAEPEDTLHTLRRVPLADSAQEGATLAVDSAGTAWLGAPGRLTALDTAGRPLARVQTGKNTVPRLLWRSGPRLVIQDGRRVAAADAAGGGLAGGWGAASFRAAARDPRGRWVFTANRRGGVVGLDAETLTPRWGWPETGHEALGMAVSPLADRVYVSVDRADEQPAAVQVRDAASGRVLFVTEQPEPLRGLMAGPDGTLYGSADGLVVRLRHAREGLPRIWAQSPDVAGPGGELELRMDPTGERIAVFGRGRGATLAVLNARTGELLGQTRTAPLDAAFGAEGRLYLLEPRTIRIVR